MDKKKLEALERKVSRRDAQQAVRNIKKADVATRAEKRYKVVMTEDGSMVARGFSNAITAANYMKHHKDYSVLDRKDWKVVLDTEE